MINSDSGSYRCGDTSANRCRRRAAVKADRVEAMVLDAVRQLGELGLLGRPASQDTLEKLTNALDDAHAAGPARSSG